MYRTVIAAMGIAVVAGCIGTPQAAADNLVCTPIMCSFLTPSRNIGCEIDFQRGNGIPDQVYCQSTNAPQSVTMSDTGEFKTCTGESCLGNPGQGTATLPYGDNAGVGPFSCYVEYAGVTCTVVAGHGFNISNEEITPVAG
ncbi:MAG: hypothetical protein ACLPXZ_26120 [Mycobacterium sp.]